MFLRICRNIGNAVRVTRTAVSGWCTVTKEVTVAVTNKVAVAVRPYWRRTATALFAAAVLFSLGCCHLAKPVTTGLLIVAQVADSKVAESILKLQATRNATTEKVEPRAADKIVDAMCGVATKHVYQTSYSSLVDKALDSLTAVRRRPIKLIEACQ